MKVWSGSVGADAPVVFGRGALGNDEDLVLSQNHRVLLTGPMAEILSGESEVLTTARSLVNGDTIYTRPGGQITYFHLLFDRHQIVFSNGARSESFHPSDADIGAFSVDARAEVLRLFPELKNDGQTACRP